MQATSPFGIVIPAIALTGALVAPPALAQSASLIRLTDTSAWSTPSPDPSALAYRPGTDRLIIADSEIEETPLYMGANVFVTERDGTLGMLLDTTALTDEPSGMTFDPISGHLFIASDNAPRRIREIDPGDDGTHLTPDDIVTSFTTTGFGSSDAEGLAWDTARGVLHLVDGALDRVFTIAPGANGQFDGASPEGDDVVTSFDTLALGISDPEGIVFDPSDGHLYVVGKPKTSLLHVTVTGQPLRTLTLDSGALIKPAGLALAPSSLGNGATSLYLVDRGVDNDVDPTENDGRLFEFTLPPLPDNGVPVVDITAPADDEVFNVGDTIGFAGSASDPEEGDLSGLIDWESDLDGPLGSGAAIAVSTLSAGVHEITASVIDSEQAQGIDMLSVRVADGNLTVLQSRVAGSADDAEQRGPGGNTWLTGNDLELVQDGSVEQIVGLRFEGIALPPGSTVELAYIQFQADEVQTAPVSLSIRAQDADDAEPIQGVRDNLTDRPLTTASVSWDPPPWNLLGEAGAAQRTADLSALIQELIERPGWNAGQAMAFLIEGSGPSRRTAESFDSEPDAAPLLYIRYSADAGPPDVRILSPATGSEFEAGDAISLVASASDVPDGNLADAVTWSSDRDGALGSGSPLTVATLTPGSHSISARVVDSDGLVDQESITIEVTEQPVQSAPTIAIDAPADGASFPAATAISLRATANDTEDGDLSAAVSWTSDVDGALGTGAPLVTLSPGAHEIGASVTDSDGLSAVASVNVTVESGTGGPQTLTLRVAGGEDDAEERGSGQVKLASGDLDMTLDGSTVQLVALRFAGLAVPRGASIVSAAVRFRADETSDVLSLLEISGEDSGDAAPFTSASGNLSSRSRTPASVPWMPEPWVRGDAGAAQRTPDLAPLVQHVVARADWSAGNALVLLIDGDGKRVAESFEGRADSAAELEVTYNLENGVPSVDAGPDTLVVDVESVALNGSASDDGEPGPLSVNWSLAEGPASVTFADASSLATTATLPLVGTYRLLLTADDGEAYVSDAIEVTREPSAGNTPPTVSAGPDQIASVGETITLDGSVVDDGRPAVPGEPVIGWSTVSGPADASFTDPAAATTTASFVEPGLYTLELDAFDGELRATDQTVVNVLDASGSGTAETRVASSTDDAEETASGRMKLDSGDLELTFDSSTQTVGLRFANLAVPQGALIDAAHIQFTVDETGSEPTTLLIATEASDDAATFPSTRSSISTRTRSGAGVSWSPAPWTGVGESGPEQRTPDLSELVQEIVSRSGWTSGNAMVFVVTGDGKRVAEAFDGSPAQAPQLRISFRTAP